jgi:hypothetical protein
MNILLYIDAGDGANQAAKRRSFIQDPVCIASMQLLLAIIDMA